MRTFAKVLYGSQNYGLDGPDSDRDYKILLCPDFDDFYRGRRGVSKEDIPFDVDPEHNSVMSVIQFHDLLMKGNPNCIEMLFSVDWKIYNKKMEPYLTKARQLYNFGYIAMVWENFYKAVKGIALNTINRDGVTGKSVSRADFFCGLIGHTIRNDFVVTENSWRGDFAFQHNARNTRFAQVGDEALKGKLRGLLDLFAENENKSIDKAKLFCKDNPFTANKMNLLVSDLNLEMRQMVYESVCWGHPQTNEQDQYNNLKMLILGSLPSISGSLLGMSEAMRYINDYAGINRIKNAIQGYGRELEGIYKAVINIGGDQGVQ